MMQLSPALLEQVFAVAQVAGNADLYPCLGYTVEWDIAAGPAVLRAAGGHVQTLQGAELGYGKPWLDNPHFVASGTID